MLPGFRMRLRMILQTMLAALLMTTGGCVFDDDDSHVEPADDHPEVPAETTLRASDYQPLVVGAEWLFDVTGQENGEPYEASDKYFISGTVDRGDTTWYVQYYAKDFQTPYERGYLDYLRITDNRLFWGGGGTLVEAAFSPVEILLEDYHNDIGVPWTIGTTESSEHTGRFIGFEDVVVTAGLFEECLVVKSILKITGDAPVTHVLHTWLAKGVGTVMIDDMSVRDGVVIRHERAELAAWYFP